MKFLKVLVLCLLFIPSSVFAETKTYNKMNLEETFRAEAEITKELETPFKYDLSGYKETDDQITIYLFRGNGCSYCNKFLTFLNSIVGEYGKYFKLESYEVWYDKTNNKLLNKVADFLEVDAGGVPYIVIGDQVFPGYASEYDEAIKSAIVELYNSSDRFDVFVEMEKAEKEANKGTDLKPIIIWNGVITLAAVGVIMYYSYTSQQKLNDKLELIQNELKNTQNEINKMNKKDSKTETKKTTKTTKKTTKK